MAVLTEKRDKFCRVYLETGNATEAYRQAYNAGKMKPECINVNASKLLTDAKVKLRLEELRKPIMERHNINVDTLIAELEEARQAALTAETVQSSAAVSATMGKAKLLGLDKQLIDLSVKVTDSGGNDW